jgi:hypothetical protein
VVGSLAIFVLVIFAVCLSAATAEIVSRIGHYRFLPDTFPTFHLSSYHSALYIVTWSDSKRDFGLDIGFIVRFNTRLMTTRPIAELHTLHITVTHAKSFPASGSCLVTASNNGYSSSLLFTAGLSTDLSAKPRHGPRRKQAVPLLPQSPWERACPLRRHLATAAYTCLLKICSVAANIFSVSGGRYPATALHATICCCCPRR